MPNSNVGMWQEQHKAECQAISRVQEDTVTPDT